VYKFLFIIFILLFPDTLLFSQESQYGRSGMPWNASPSVVLREMRTPDIIMLDSNEVVWLNKDYFGERYSQIAERFEVDTNKNINNIINEYSDYRFTYYDVTISRVYSTLSIHFENNYASCENYYIYVEDLTLEEKNNLYSYFKNQFQGQYGIPKSISENDIFKTLKWERYYTNIEIQLYTSTPSPWNPTPSSRGDYLKINYERNETSKKHVGLGFEIIETSKLWDNITNDQFTIAIEEFKRMYRENAYEVGDLVPNARENDPLTIGVNHILNTTNHKANELWTTKLYYEKIETWVFIYIWFTNTSPTGYHLRGIILPYSGFNLM